MLTITFHRQADGSVVSRYERANCTATWQRQQEPRASFFVIHDLEHYAVETILRYNRGFYGLLAEGWDISDFGSPWPRGPLPAEALIPELIVGFLDAERGAGCTWTAADLNEKLAAYFAERGGMAHTPVEDAQLRDIRACAARLAETWAALPQGQALTLHIPSHGTSPEQPVTGRPR